MEMQTTIIPDDDLKRKADQLEDDEPEHARELREFIRKRREVIQLVWDLSETGKTPDEVAVQLNQIQEYPFEGEWTPLEVRVFLASNLKQIDGEWVPTIVDDTLEYAQKQPV